MDLITKINKAANEISKGINSINGIPIYVDPHSEKDTIYVGRKGDANWIIMNPEVYDILFEEEKINQDRYDKLSKILEEILKNNFEL